MQRLESVSGCTRERSDTEAADDLAAAEGRHAPFFASGIVAVQCEAPNDQRAADSPPGCPE